MSKQNLGFYFALTCVWLAEGGDHFGRALGIQVKVIRPQGPRDDRHTLQAGREGELTQDTHFIRKVLKYQHVVNISYLKVRPPLNKKSFSVHRPGGLKRADWNFFSSYFQFFFKLF